MDLPQNQALLSWKSCSGLLGKIFCLFLRAYVLKKYLALPLISSHTPYSGQSLLPMRACFKMLQKFLLCSEAPASTHTSNHNSRQGGKRSQSDNCQGTNSTVLTQLMPPNRSHHRFNLRQFLYWELFELLKKPAYYSPPFQVSCSRWLHTRCSLSRLLHLSWWRAWDVTRDTESVFLVHSFWNGCCNFAIGPLLLFFHPLL